MFEQNTQSPDFQRHFREGLRKNAPAVLETVSLLEKNGLVVVGYALLPSGEVVLDVGVPAKGSEMFKPAFELRINPFVYPPRWNFSAYEYMDETPSTPLVQPQ